MSLQRKQFKIVLGIVIGLIIGLVFARILDFSNSETSLYLPSSVPTIEDDFLGPKVNLKSEWVGAKKVSRKISILVMAGHADSQGIYGSGTSGEAVAIKGFSPMYSSISDELFWNIKVQNAIVELGRIAGLNINSYDPGVRTIVEENDPRTNWSVGAEHSKQGGYVLEIHFDSYGKDGHGSGLIPALTNDLNQIDESLAKTFGRYPLFFRGGLGAPKRGIRILEIGKLEGELEKRLRDPLLRDATIDSIAIRIVNAIQTGINQK